MGVGLHPPPEGRGFSPTRDKIEEAMIVKALERNNWNRTYAAKELGISLRTIRNKINKLEKEGYHVKKNSEGRK